MDAIQVRRIDRMRPALPARLFGTIVTVAAIALVAYALAAGIRYGLIEREDLGPVCDALPMPWWCELRMLVIRAFINDVFGRASVAVAALAFWRRSALAAYLAIAVGTCGMTLYGFTWSAVGVICGVMALARLQGKWGQSREAEQEAR